MAKDLPDDDEIFQVEFSDGTTEGRVKYCREVIPLLLKRLEDKSKAAAGKTKD